MRRCYGLTVTTSPRTRTESLGGVPRGLLRRNVVLRTLTEGGPKDPLSGNSGP